MGLISRAAILVLAALLQIILSAAPAAALERRIALVIGNNTYVAARPLTKPVNDAKRVAEVLSQIGYDVVQMANLSHAEMTKALGEFGARARSADWAVIYFSGHGSEVNGSTQIFPIDGGLDPSGTRIVNGVSLDLDLIGAVQGARKFKAIILDACRANPFAETAGPGAKEIGSQLARGAGSTAGGLVRPKTALNNMLVVYAAQAGDVAYEGDGLNSFFTTAFLDHVGTPNIDAPQLVGLVTQQVLRLTKDVQRPGMYGTPVGSARHFFVDPSRQLAPVAAPKPLDTTRQAVRFSETDRKLLVQRGAAVSACTAPAKVEVECGPKATPSERLMCSNFELLRLDAELNRAWDCIPAERRKALGRAQRTWWQTTREQCVVPGWESDRSALTNSWICLSAVYLSRIEELRRLW